MGEVEMAVTASSGLQQVVGSCGRLAVTARSGGSGWRLKMSHGVVGSWGRLRWRLQQVVGSCGRLAVAARSGGSGWRLKMGHGVVGSWGRLRWRLQQEVEVVAGGLR
ncbi:hypothetical protein L1887_07126 [Cichorium endivia]|nr:hypothetical protein L1887_07126 [Cichorium endivia]